MAARARKRTNAANAASNAAAANNAATQNKRRKPTNTQPLGLKLMDDNNNNSSSSNANDTNGTNESTVVRLYVGNILGRRPTKRVPANIVTPVRPVDIGIVDCHIPRKLLQVSRVTPETLELDVFFDRTEPNNEKATKAHRKCAKLAADICKITRNDQVLQVERGRTIVLEPHDILVVAKTCKGCDFFYQFQVLPVAQETASISPNQSMEDQDSTVKEEDAPDSLAVMDAELDELEQKLGFRPYRPTRTMGSTCSNNNSTATAAAAASSVQTRQSPTNRNNMATPNKLSQDTVDSESEDETDVKDPQKTTTMHATLANTYYKALNTSTPHFGSSLLLLTRSKQEFPTPHLVQDLIKLLTFGPTYHEDYAFYEGNRLQLALDYVQILLRLYPKDMGPRFLQAAQQIAGENGDYWRLCLDQLPILPYPHSMTTTTTTTTTKTESSEVAERKRLLQSLEMHAVSLQFFQILLQQTDLLSRQEQIHGNAAKDFIRHLARIMAQTWVSRGHYLLLTSLQDQPLVYAIEQVTQLLTQVLGCVVNPEFVDNNFQEQDLVDILWNAMDEQQRQQQQSWQEMQTKDKRQVLLTWIFQLEGLSMTTTTTTTTNIKWTRVTDGLVKRARLRKEYNALALPTK